MSLSLQPPSVPGPPLRRLGAKVLVVKADVSIAGEVARVLAAIKVAMPPLRGVFHAAMILDDGLLSQQTEERFTRVVGPKAIGAWNLHTALAEAPLDYFVMFSNKKFPVGWTRILKRKNRRPHVP